MHNVLVAKYNIGVGMAPQSITSTPLSISPFINDLLILGPLSLPSIATTALGSFIFLDKAKPIL